MNAKEMVARAKHLPPVSHAALKLVSLLGQSVVSNEDIVQVLKCDNVLTAKLLRACNSPALGLEEPVSSIDQAVLILGHNQILQMVLNLTFSSTMAVPLAGYAVEATELWSHSLVTATAAEVAASHGLQVEVDPPIAFTIGLLHDIGKLVMNEVLTVQAQFGIRERITKEGMSRVEAERKVTGADHAEVGACLLATWRLPDAITEAVANHHQPVFTPTPRLSVLAYLANCLAHLGGSSPGWEAYALRADDNLAQALNLSENDLESLVIKVRDRFDKLNEFMKVA
ncbi:MAG TPA: HDOD domain-containing protein [Clostridia bacterium]|nr:HDOD domain-containing protein [Clostridia bacterium]